MPKKTRHWVRLVWKKCPVSIEQPLLYCAWFVESCKTSLFKRENRNFGIVITLFLSYLFCLGGQSHSWGGALCPFFAKRTLGGIARICFKSLRTQIQRCQGFQMIRNFVRNLKIVITRSTIQLKMCKIKNN